MRVSILNPPCRQGLAAAAVAWLAATTAQAQIIYESDNRGVSASAGFDTNNLPPGAFGYTGDYFASAGPSTPFADFSASLGGTPSFNYPIFNTTNTVTASAEASQTSSLEAQEIAYSSWVQAYQSSPLQPHSSESSVLDVSFMVPATESYELTCQGGLDPVFSAESWRLSSANLGVLVSGSDYGHNSGVPFSYSGLLLPGDVYTLTLQETALSVGQAEGDAGYLQVELAVPEPASNLLLGMGLCGLIALGMKRLPRLNEAATSDQGKRN